MAAYGALLCRAMNIRTRTLLGSIAGALSIHLVMVACSSGGAPPGAATGQDGGILADVREMLADVLDAETRDAHAGGGHVYEISCDQVSTSRGTYAPDGGVVVGSFENTSWWGVVPGVTVNPHEAPRITAYTCDPTAFSPPPNPCPAGWQCEQSGFVHRQNACVAGYASIDTEGRVVVACGNRSMNTNGAGMTTTTGARYQRAFVRIE